MLMCFTVPAIRPLPLLAAAPRSRVSALAFHAHHSAQTSHSRASITTMKASDESVGRSSEIGMGMGDEPDILLSEVVDGCSVDDPHLEACLVAMPAG